MSRKDFKAVRDVAIGEILLDMSNARIRAGHDQADCVQRILRKEDQLIALAEDIAEHGLNTIPILVSPAPNKQHVVRDGNRRITALKLLNDPERWSPDTRLKAKFAAIRKQYQENIPYEIDVLSSTNEAAIIREVISRHSGAAGGVGQLDWSAYLRTVYLVTHQLPAEYKRPGQYAFWAEDHDINVGDDFPISTLQRFFTKENLARLGFDISDKDELIPNLRLDVVKKIATTIMGDFESVRINVDSVRSPADATAYITRVRSMHGLVEPAPPPSSPTSAPAPPPTAGPSPAPAPSPGGGQAPMALGQPATPSPSPPAPAPSPKTLPSDRKRIFGRSSPGIAIPAAEKKAATIVVELRLMDLDDTPFAASMLLRALVEISDEHYRKKMSILDKNALYKNVAASSDSMLNRKLLTSSEHDIVKRVCGGDSASFLHIETLQRMLHRNTHHSSKQFVNNMWDNLCSFIQACWR